MAVTARRLPGIAFEAEGPPPLTVLPRMDVAVLVGFAASGPLDIPVAVCLARLTSRGIRPVPPHAVRRQQRDLRRSLAGLLEEGFSAIYAIDSPEAAATVHVERIAPVGAVHNAMSRRNRARRDDARSSNRHRNA